MQHTQQKNHSVWQRVPFVPCPALDKDLSTDVCVVGAGITGLTTAYLLLRKGLRVIVLEKENFGSDETGLTTAHLSNALDDRYTQLRKWHGDRGIQLAYESHSAAIQTIEDIVREEQIDCHFLRLSGYLFLAPDHDIQYLRDEMQAARVAGFTSIELLNQAPVTLMDTGYCLHFPNQAQFHPLLYLQGLVRAILRMGGRIFTETRVTDIQGGKDTTVTVEDGFKVRGQHCVVATNVPFNNRFSVHIKESSFRSYVIGLRVPKGKMHPVLLWDTETPYHYARMHSDPHQEYDLLLVGGEDHRTGQKKDADVQFLKLKTWAREMFAIEPEVLSRWSGQIIEPVDGLAYIGQNPGDAENIYIASGDSGHGITHGTIAGLLIRDMIMERPNEWSYLYNPSRMNIRTLGHFLRENFNVASQYRDWFVGGEPPAVQSPDPGQGAVIRNGISKIAVYCDLKGEQHCYSAVCPHLGGIVHWNAAEKTWDCPCHGSRFNRYGETLNGPANADLQPLDPMAARGAAIEGKVQPTFPVTI